MVHLDFKGTRGMTIGTLFVWLFVGAVAGWLATSLMRTGGFGLVGNIVVGIVGALFGGWLFPQVGINAGAGIINTIITATMGAVVLLFLARLFRRA